MAKQVAFDPEHQGRLLLRVLVCRGRGRRSKVGLGVLDRSTEGVWPILQQPLPMLVVRVDGESALLVGDARDERKRRKHDTHTPHEKVVKIRAVIMNCIVRAHNHDHICAKLFNNIKASKQ
jgi:hypothetical protein